jgi:HIV Tat-specific factor 1
LPENVTKEDLHDYFKKCGAFKIDAVTGEDAIKVYKDEHGVPKGDARIGFAKPESVETAIQMLD